MEGLAGVDALIMFDLAFARQGAKLQIGHQVAPDVVVTRELTCSQRRRARYSMCHQRSLTLGWWFACLPL
jgi:hypothetical protein